MRVGFTGTREGMTPAQMCMFGTFVSELPVFAEFHHGACVGADEEAVAILRDMWDDTDTDARTWRVIAHPCDLPRFVSRVANGESDEAHPPMRPLDRNRRVVDAADVLLVCPKGDEKLRSGTWATVRYARKRGRRVVIFWPDGTVTQEGPADANR